MSIIVLLSPIHFFLLLIIIYKSKTAIFSSQRETIITSHFRKLTKVSINNFNIDINGISDPLEVSKNVISALILIYQPIRNFIPCLPEVDYTILTLKKKTKQREIKTEHNIYNNIVLIQMNTALHVF